MNKQHKTFITLSVIISIGWLWVALQSFNNYLAIELINQESPDYLSLINTIDPLFSEALFFAGLGYVGGKEQQSEEQQSQVPPPDYNVERVFSEVAWNRPASPAAWVELAEWSAQQGLLENAMIYAESAYLLLDNKPSLGWELFDLFLYLGNRQRASSVASLYVINFPDAVADVISRMREGQFADKEIVSALLGDDLIVEFPHENIDRIMTRVVQLKEEAIAKGIWSTMTIKGIKFPANVTQFFFNELKKNHDFLMMQKVLESLSQWHGFNYILPLSEKYLNKGNYCWHIEDSKDQFDWGWDTPPSGKGDGNSSLRIDFNQNSNMNMNHVSCDYLVQSENNSMLISGYWKGEHVTSDEGVYIEVVDIDDQILSASPKRAGSWEWQRFDIVVPVKHGISMNKVVIRRIPSINLDNKLSGSVWFSDLSIQ